MAVSFDHISLASPDLDRAVRFYQDIMGFEKVSRKETEAVFRIGDSLLVVFHGPETYGEKPRHPRSGVHHIAFCLGPADYDALLRRINECDVSVMMQENNDGAQGIGFATYFYDPDNIEIEIKRYDDPPEEPSLEWYD